MKKKLVRLTLCLAFLPILAISCASTPAQSTAAGITAPETSEPENQGQENPQETEDEDDELGGESFESADDDEPQPDFSDDFTAPESSTMHEIPDEIIEPEIITLEYEDDYGQPDFDEASEKENSDEEIVIEYIEVFDTTDEPPVDFSETDSESEPEAQEIGSENQNENEDETSEQETQEPTEQIEQTDAGDEIDLTEQQEEPTEPVPSRNITMRIQEYLDVTYPGSGWIFMGLTDGSKGMTYSGRKLGTKDTVFTLQSKEPGTKILHFYRIDPLTGSYIDDYIEVEVLDETSSNETHVSAPDYTPPLPKKAAELVQKNADEKSDEDVPQVIDAESQNLPERESEPRITQSAQREENPEPAERRENPVVTARPETPAATLTTQADETSVANQTAESRQTTQTPRLSYENQEANTPASQVAENRQANQSPRMSYENQGANTPANQTAENGRTNQSPRLSYENQGANTQASQATENRQTNQSPRLSYENQGINSPASQAVESPRGDNPSANLMYDSGRENQGAGFRSENQRENPVINPPLENPPDSLAGQRPVYSESAGIDVEYLLKEAEQHYNAKEYSLANQKIREFLEYAMEKRDAGLFLQGQILEAKSEIQDIRAAIESYRTLTRNYPDSPYWEQANKQIIYLNRFYLEIR